MATNKGLIGVVLAGVGIFALTKLAGGTSSLYDQYRFELRDATSVAQLDEIYSRIEADYPSRLSPSEYQVLYDYYVIRRGEV